MFSVSIRLKSYLLPGYRKFSGEIKRWVYNQRIFSFTSARTVRSNYDRQCVRIISSWLHCNCSFFLNFCQEQTVCHMKVFRFSCRFTSLKIWTCYVIPTKNFLQLSWKVQCIIFSKARWRVYVTQLAVYFFLSELSTASGW